MKLIWKFKKKYLFYKLNNLFQKANRNQKCKIQFTCEKTEQEYRNVATENR